MTAADAAAAEAHLHLRRLLRIEPPLFVSMFEDDPEALAWRWTLLEEAPDAPDVPGASAATKPSDEGEASEVAPEKALGSRWRACASGPLTAPPGEDGGTARPLIVEDGAGPKRLSALERLAAEAAVREWRRLQETVPEEAPFGVLAPSWIGEGMLFFARLIKAGLPAVIELSAGAKEAAGFIEPYLLSRKSLRRMPNLSLRQARKTPQALYFSGPAVRRGLLRFEGLDWPVVVRVLPASESDMEMDAWMSGACVFEDGYSIDGWKRCSRLVVAADEVWTGEVEEEPEAAEFEDEEVPF